MSTQPRNVVITGAGSGIGAATAKAFVDSGDHVHLLDISQDRLNALSANLSGVSTYRIDVADAKGVREVIERIDKEFGSVDVLVSNAGIFDGLAGIQDTSYELWDRIISVNLTGSFNVIKPTSEVMLRQKSGRIITISSIAATRTSPDGLSYDTSKAGLEGMTRRLAVDLGPHGITANSVAPGAINTDILANSRELLGEISTVAATAENDVSNQLLETIVPARRSGEPEEIAATIHFLASKGAAYINGEVIHVDGGWIAS